MLSLLKSGVLKTNKAASEQIRSASPNPVFLSPVSFFLLFSPLYRIAQPIRLAGGLQSVEMALFRGTSRFFVYIYGLIACLFLQGVAAGKNSDASSGKSGYTYGQSMPVTCLNRTM